MKQEKIGSLELSLIESYPLQKGLKQKKTARIQIPTYKNTDLYACLVVKNSGMEPLNDLRIIHKGFSEEFRPPQFSEITLISNNFHFKLSEDSISTNKHSVKDVFNRQINKYTLVIELKNLVDTDLGMIFEEDILHFYYPIHCKKPPRDASFQPEVILFANTKPSSNEIKYKIVSPTVETVHLRRKYRIGKEVIPEGMWGEYEIILSLENIGEEPQKNVILMDTIKDSFEYFSYSPSILVKRDIGQDILMWRIKKIECLEKIEISYKIRGYEEYYPTDAKLVL